MKAEVGRERGTSGDWGPAIVVRVETGGIRMFGVALSIALLFLAGIVCLIAGIVYAVRWESKEPASDDRGAEKLLLTEREAEA